MTASSASTLQIGQVAALAGVHVQTVRYYETRGLLEPIGRTAGGFRMYDGEAVRAVRFVKRAQQLGFTLDEARELLQLRQGGSRRQVRALAEHKLEDIAARIRDLDAVNRALRTLVDGCRCDEDATEPLDPEGCSILAALDGSADPLDHSLTHN